MKKMEWDREERKEKEHGRGSRQEKQRLEKTE